MSRTASHPEPGCLPNEPPASPKTEATVARTSAYPPPAGVDGAASVPGYELEGELGRGGMGVVYKARQTALQRSVALKVILAGGQDNQAVRERFHREAEAIARLQHPNVVQIYEVGDSGAPYYVMEFCAGGNLSRRLAATPQPPRWSADLAATLARAMHHTHDRGIIHRDLKPPNVLLTEEETVKISDFGLARMMDGAALTASGEVMGTPSYMAPEQAWGGELVGAAADIYALGAILYECLTGRPPFKAGTPLETLRQVVDADPVPPRRLAPGVPRDLETICLKCLRKQPNRRYAAALALAEDLDRFLAGRPILARPIGLCERAGKWVSRQPLAAALLGLVVLSTLGGVAGVTVAWRRAEHAAEEMRKAHTGEAERSRELEQQLYFSRISQAERELRAGKTAWARRLLDLCPESLRRWEWHYLDRLCRGEKNALWPGSHGSISSVAFNREGTILASSGGDGVVRLWRIADGKILHLMEGHRNSVNWVCFAPDGRQLASASEDRTVMVWDVLTGRRKKSLQGHEQPVSVVAFHPGGRFLASATFDVDGDSPGEVWLWDVEGGESVARFRGHTSRITGLAGSGDGSLLLSASHDGTVRVLDGRTLEEKQVFHEHAFPVSAVAVRRDGELAASAAGRSTAEQPDQGEVLIWRVDGGEVLHRLKGHAKRPMAVAFSPDGERLVTGGMDGEVKLWDVKTGQEVLSLPADADGVLCVAFSADGRFLAAGGIDRQVRVWQGGP